MTITRRLVSIHSITTTSHEQILQIQSLRLLGILLTGCANTIKNMLVKSLCQVLSSSLQPPLVSIYHCAVCQGDPVTFWIPVLIDQYVGERGVR